MVVWGHLFGMFLSWVWRLMYMEDYPDENFISIRNIKYVYRDIFIKPWLGKSTESSFTVKLLIHSQLHPLNRDYKYSELFFFLSAMYVFCATKHGFFPVAGGGGDGCLQRVSTIVAFARPKCIIHPLSSATASASHAELSDSISQSTITWWDGPGPWHPVGHTTLGVMLNLERFFRSGK